MVSCHVLRKSKEIVSAMRNNANTTRVQIIPKYLHTVILFPSLCSNPAVVVSAEIDAT